MKYMYLFNRKLTSRSLFYVVVFMFLAENLTSPRARLRRFWPQVRTLSLSVEALTTFVLSTLWKQGPWLSGAVKRPTSSELLVQLEVCCIDFVHVFTVLYILVEAKHCVDGLVCPRNWVQPAATSSSPLIRISWPVCKSLHKSWFALCLRWKKPGIDCHHVAWVDVLRPWRIKFAWCSMNAWYFEVCLLRRLLCILVEVALIISHCVLCLVVCLLWCSHYGTQPGQSRGWRGVWSFQPWLCWRGCSGENLWRWIDLDQGVSWPILPTGSFFCVLSWSKLLLSITQEHC